jgi:hypothetical protein
MIARLEYRAVDILESSRRHFFAEEGQQANDKKCPEGKRDDALIR